MRKYNSIFSWKMFLILIFVTLSSGCLREYISEEKQRCLLSRSLRSSKDRQTETPKKITK